MDSDEADSIDSFFSHESTNSDVSTYTCATASDSPIYQQQRMLYETLCAQKNRRAVTRYIKKRRTSVERGARWHSTQEDIDATTNLDSILVATVLRKKSQSFRLYKKI